MRNRLAPAAVVLAAALGLAACGSGDSASTVSQTASQTASQRPTDDQVLALFDEWNDSLSTGDPKAVVAQYTQDAVLLPTVAGAVHDTPEEKEEYFTEFLMLKPSGTWVESKVRVMSADTAVLSGLYDFAITRDGKPETVKARGTFVFQKQADGEWQIVEHHSSKVPA